MAQSASRFCPTCKSFFHGPDTCPTTFLTYQPVSNTLVDSDTDTKTADLTLLDSPSTPNVSLASELQLRAMVAEGTGNVRRSCTKHRLVQLQLTRGDPARRQSRMTVVLDAFDEDCVVNRSLLPVCSTCMHAETGLQEKDLASGLDMCRCATLLVEAECFNCLLCEINGALKCALLKRTKTDTDGSCKIACRCGNEVGVQETARQCVHCRGIATAPFCGYDGQDLDFECGAEAPTPSIKNENTEEDSA
jgi:hypothetical protein